MINYDNVAKENINKHNLNWLQIPDPPYRISIIEGSGSGKPDSLLHLIKTKMIMIIVLLIKFVLCCESK